MMRRMTQHDHLTPTDIPPPAPPPASPLAPGLGAWLREGLRAGCLLAPRPMAQGPSAPQLLALAALTTLVWTLLARLQVVGPAHLNAQAWLATWWSLPALLWLAWWALPSASVPGNAAAQAAADAATWQPPGLSTWLALALVAGVPVEVVTQGLAVADAHGVLPAALLQHYGVTWGLYLLYWVWAWAVGVRLVRALGATQGRSAGFGLGLALLFALSVWHFDDRVWEADHSGEPGAPPMVLSQAVFESQQKVLSDALATLAPERPGVVDVYGLVYAPYASENVFMREADMVAKLLETRFDAAGRTVQLVNHATTAETLAWATPHNLERAMDALARRMDRHNDLLVVYLTSHGASDFQLAAEHWPLSVESLTPQRLRAALDRAGIRHRVIAVSACYSGGWVAPLATDTTLVMAAADADHTSYGCGRLSALTFFGRAVFDEQLRHTLSFEKAFAAAVPVIRLREVEGGKPDGFSNPQIQVGEQIRPVLKAVEQRLESKP